jgi:hypothetical protein
MRLHFTNEWLRDRIEKDADIECDAGIPPHDSVAVVIVARPEATPKRKVMAGATASVASSSMPVSTKRP